MKKVILQVEMSTDREGSTQTGELELEIKEGLTAEQEQDEFCVAASEWALQTMNLNWQQLT